MRALCCCLLRITFGVESANLNTWSAVFYDAGSSAISDVIFIAEKRQFGFSYETLSSHRSEIPTSQ